jgi:hypothetical protein
MKQLTLNTFLNFFSRKDIPTFTEWVKKANVRSAKKITPLALYQTHRNISTEHLKKLYLHIINRNEYLYRFYQRSLAISCLEISDTPMPRSHLDNDTKLKYKNLIRNLHFRDILQETKSGLTGIPSFLDVLIDLYLKDIIDYKILTPSALFYLDKGHIGSVLSSYYFRASILNPYLVFSLNKSVLHGTRIFTPTLGWSSYAYGFAECPEVLEYVGVDVIPNVCQKTADLLTEHYPNILKNFFCIPSESLLSNISFMTKYKNHFDVVFFSPPYYELEIYPGNNQSTTIYKSYPEWLEGYWKRTIMLCHKVLQKGGRLCYILSSGGGPNSGDILKDMNNITKQMFSLRTTIPMYNKNVHVTAKSHRETAEKIMVFIK